MAEPILLPPNRVWRSYRGGAVLDRIEGRAAARDDHWPEDWIGSTTRARNPQAAGPDEGLSRCVHAGADLLFADLLRQAPEYFLGAAHCARHGPEPGILVKYLDAAVRLHIQVHPTAAFARTHLGSRHGKAEAYYILAVRPECADPHLLLGFQRPPGSRRELRRWLEEQDLPALRAAFDPIPVRPGDCLHIPGGMPHAIGAGICMVELMEPSDWVVRCECEHNGYRLPASARYLNSDPELSIACFDLRARSAAQVRRECFAAPRALRQLGPGTRLETLIDGAQTPAFRMRRVIAREACVLPGGEPFIGLMVAGAGGIGDGWFPYTSRMFFPAGVPEWKLRPDAAGCTLLLCLPPAADAS
jgi:mannose-6-phosphate isomerase